MRARSNPACVATVAGAALLVALRSAPAGEPPTARIMVNPVPAKVGPPYPPLADGGPNIVGNELRLDAGGVRVWVEAQFADWDPNGDGSPGATFFQVTLDGSGLLDADTDGDDDLTDDGDQDDIVPAAVPCDSDNSRAVCSAAFGEYYPEFQDFCGRFHVCPPVYPDKDGIRPDGWCACCCDCGANPIITELGWTVYGCYMGAFRPDDGTVRWGATAVYELPPNAKGKYTVQLDPADTFLRRGLTEVPSFSETGFVINILTGRCCFGVGTPAAGCMDGVTRAECGDDEPTPFVFTPGVSCPPEGRDCEPVTVSCCDGDPFIPCRDDLPVSACQCPGCTWDQFRTCAEIECPRKPIPAASTWGLAILTLLLMIGAKVVFRRSAESPGVVSQPGIH